MIRWGILILFIGLISGYTATASNTIQTANVQDSIPIWANRAKNSTDLSWNERHALITKAYEQNSNLKEKSKRVKNLSRISLAYSILGDSVHFRKTNKELIALSNQLEDYIAHGEAHWDLGYFFEKSQPDSAYYHYKEAYSLFKRIDYVESLASKKEYPGRMLMAMADVREKNKDYIGAEKEVIAAIEEFKAIDANKRLFRAYNILGIIQESLEKYDKALEYYAKAQDFLPFLEESKQEENRQRLSNNIAWVHFNKGDYQKAFELYTDLEKEVLNTNNQSLLIRKVHASKAMSGFKGGQLEAEEALALIETSNKGLDSLGNTYDMARNQQYAAEILWAGQKTDAAISKALEAKSVAERTGNNDRLLETLKFLSQIDSEKSAQHAKAYFDLNEQLQLQERTIQDKFARIQMETDEIIEENESLAKRAALWSGIALGLLLLGIGVFIIISQRISNQRLRFQQKQQENNQEIYNLMLAQHGKMEEGKKSEQKRVSEELHDGILGQMLGIRLLLSGLNERNDPSAVEQRVELIEKLRELEEEIRTISHELNASAYEKVHNFILSLQDLVDTVEKSSKISIDFEYDDHFKWDSLHNDIKINSYRITQELLQNCVKHAQCKNAVVIFKKSKNLLSLSVEDDGIGFDDSKAKRGIGLKNIISRVKKMGAEWKIESQPSKGTKVIITIPNIDLRKEHPKSRNARNTVLEA